MRARLSAVLSAPTVQLLTSGGAGAGTGVINTLDPSQKAFAQQAYVKSLRGIWYFAVAMAAAAVLVSLFISKMELMTEHTETATGLDAEEANRQRALALEQESRARKALHKGESPCS